MLTFSKSELWYVLAELIKTNIGRILIWSNRGNVTQLSSVVLLPYNLAQYKQDTSSSSMMGD